MIQAQQKQVFEKPIVREFLQNFVKMLSIISSLYAFTERFLNQEGFGAQALSTSLVCGAIIGQALIPIPLVGGIIGGYWGIRGRQIILKEMIQKLQQNQLADGHQECNKVNLEIMVINLKILNDYMPMILSQDSDRQTKWMNLIVFGVLSLFFDSNEMAGEWQECLVKNMQIKKIMITDTLDNLKQIVEVIVKNLQLYINLNMKIPLNTLEQPKEIDRRLLASILASPNFLEELLQLVNDKSNAIHKLSLGSLTLLMDKLDDYIQNIAQLVQQNSRHDCSQILNLINSLMEYECYRKLFNSLEHLLCIVEHTDNLQNYETIMNILIKICDQAINLNNPQQKEVCNQQLRDNIPRLIYLNRFLFDHNNTLSSTKLELIDYYHDDPNYLSITDNPIQFPQLQFEYIEPTILDEPYTDLCKNGVHKKELQHQTSIKNFNIQDDNSMSALLLAKSILGQQDMPLTPLVEAVKYRILIYRGLSENKIQTKTLVLGMHILSLEMNMLLDAFCSTHDCAFLLDQVFVEKIEYEQYFSIYAKLFQLKTVQPKLLVTILSTLDEILVTERQQENEIALNTAKNYDETFLQLIYDVLSMQPHQIEIEQTYPLKYNAQLLNEQCAKDEEVGCGIFRLFSSESGVLLLSRSNIALGSSQALIRTLFIQDNKSYLPPEILKAAIGMLGRLSRKEDLQRDLKIFNDLIKVVENLIAIGPNLIKPTDQGFQQVTFDETDSIISFAVQSINEHFKDDLGRRYNRANAPTIARKVSETQIIKKLSYLLQESRYTLITQQTLILISHLANEVPTLIGRLIDSQLPQQLNSIIQNLNYTQINNKMVNAIFQFYFNVSLKEEGYDQFNNFGLQFMQRILDFCLIQNNVPKELLASVGQNIAKYLQKIDKVGPQVINILNISLDRLYTYLIDKKNNLKDDTYQSYYEIIIKISNLSILTFKMIHNLHPSQQAEMNTKGFFEKLLLFFEFPTFDIKIDLTKVFRLFAQLDEFDTPFKALSKVLDSISKLENKLGCALENTNILIDDSYYNSEKFFLQCPLDQLQQKLESVSYYSQIESLMEVLKHYLINGQIRYEQQEIGKLLNKSCSLLLILLRSIKYGEDLKIDLAFKKSVFYQYIQLLKVIIINSYRAMRRINNELQPLSNLFCQLSQNLRNDNIQVIQLHSYLIYDLLNNLVEGRKYAEFQNLNPDFLNLLINSDFLENLKSGISSFIQLVGQKNNIEFVDQLGLQYANIIKLIYLNKIDQSKKIQGYMLIPKQIEEIQNLLTITQCLSDDPIYAIQEILLNKTIFIFRPSFLQEIVQKDRDNIFQKTYQVFRDENGGEIDILQQDPNEVRTKLRDMGYQDDVITIALQNNDIYDVFINQRKISIYYIFKI